MYIYNVTVNVADPIREDWLLWMRKTHIPEMLATGKFSGARLCKVRVEEETGGTTYAVQYHTHSLDWLQRYYREDADRLRKDGLSRFGDQMVAFRTELEILSEH